MSQYTSSKEGFQQAMETSMSGKPEDAKSFAESIATPSFYHVLNGQRKEYQEWLDQLVQMRGVMKDWKVEIEKFLRDGDQLAARMVASFKMEGNEVKMESHMFATVDKDGRISSMIEMHRNP